jgi:hypothetical protein
LSDKDDPELESLQRELDDAFATTRPRRGFEDELWVRMQARRPLWVRVRDAIVSLGALFREAPAIPLGAVAVLLVVVIGAGVLLSSGLHPMVATRGGALSQSAPDLALGEFGRLPTPALHPGLVDQAGTSGQTYAPLVPAVTAASNLYFGPAQLTWAGTFPTATADAPVYRYVEPTPDQQRQFLATLGTTLSTVAIGTEPRLPREPIYVVAASGSDVPSGSEPADVANTFLATHNLTPQWPYLLTVRTVGGVTAVRYARGFADDGGTAYLIDWNGEPYGIEVDIGSGRLVATGPLPVSLDETPYRQISNDSAVRMALASSPASSQGIQPVPAVNLTKVELVYALAVSKGQGFYEPAYLFSGTFSYNGQTYTKRVLVPLVDPSLRSSS